MLHAPAPAVRGTPRTESGRRVLQETGCTRCHVEDWQIEARNEARGLQGDRRLFELRTRSVERPDGTVDLAGSLVPLWTRSPSGEHAPRGGAYRVERIYTDFKHWDLGPELDERRFDGTLQREHRTAPLWGVGSTAPYGHAGQYLTLDAVIRAHGGAADNESALYRQLPAAQRDLLLAYLESLVLYSTDKIRATSTATAWWRSPSGSAASTSATSASTRASSSRGRPDTGASRRSWTRTAASAPST